MSCGTICAVTVARFATIKLVKHNQLIMFLTIVVNMVIVYNFVAVGVDVFADSCVTVSTGALACFYSAEGITGRTEFAIVVICPVTVGNGNVLTREIRRNCIANIVAVRIIPLTGITDQHTAAAVRIPFISRGNVVVCIDDTSYIAVLQVNC